MRGRAPRRPARRRSRARLRSRAQSRRDMRLRTSLTPCGGGFPRVSAPDRSPHRVLAAVRLRQFPQLPALERAALGARAQANRAHRRRRSRSGSASTGLRSSSATSGRSTARRESRWTSDRRARSRRRRGAPRKPCTSCPALPPCTSSSASRSVSGAIRNCAPPISSAKTPPGPNATSGPKTGSWTMPASSSVPPRDHRLHEQRRRRCARLLRGPRRRSARFERDAAALGLVHAGGGRLEDDGKAERARGCDGLVGVARRPARGRAARRTPSAALGSRPARARRRRSSASAVVDEPARGGAVDAVERGNACRQGGAATPPARRRRRARARPTPDTRTSRRAIRRRAALPACRRRSRRPRAPASRTARARRVSRIAAATSSAPATTGGTKRTITASTPGSREHERQRARVRLARRGAEQVDRVRDARLARQHRGERLPRLRASAPAARARPRRRRRRRGCRGRRHS